MHYNHREFSDPPTPMEMVFYLIDHIPDFAQLIALELKKIHAPYQDAISCREAYKRYGTSWIKRYTEHKQLHPEYIGQRKMYSVAEIERVRVKEREAPKLIFREKKR